MAKSILSLTDVATAVAEEYVQPTAEFDPTYEDFTELLDKIAFQFHIECDEVDHLEMFDDVALDYGTSVEEYFVEVLAVKDFDPTSTPFNKDKPSILKQYYYRSSDKKIELPLSSDQMARAMLSPKALGELTGFCMQRIQDSKNTYKFFEKKQALGERIKRIDDATPVTGNPNYLNMVIPITIPDDEATSIAFVKSIKTAVENLAFQSNKYNIKQVIKSSKPSNLLLIIKKGVMPTVSTDALANAFNKGELDPKITQVIVDDFGDEPTGEIYAMLIDKRSLRYITTRNKTVSDVNNNALTTLITHHFGHTIVDSPFANTILFADR